MEQHEPYDYEDYYADGEYDEEDWIPEDEEDMHL